jgi:hypothetical protein
MKAKLIFTALLMISLSGFSQDTKQDSIDLSKETPQDTLEPFDRSTEKHIEFPNANRPPSNATRPPEPKQKQKATGKKL